MRKVIHNGIDFALNGIQYALALGDINEVGTTISLGLAIICSLIIIIPKVIKLIKNLIKWFKKAIADGKITEEEINEGINVIQEGVNDIKKGDKK